MFFQHISCSRLRFSFHLHCALYLTAETDSLLWSLYVHVSYCWDWFPLMISLCTCILLLRLISSYDLFMYMYLTAETDSLLWLFTCLRSSSRTPLYCIELEYLYFHIWNWISVLNSRGIFSGPANMSRLKAQLSLDANKLYVSFYLICI